MAETESIEELKICKACFDEKPVSEFYYRNDTGKYKSVCKRCQIDGKYIKNQDHKLCSICKVAKPTSEFQKAGGGKWLQPYCKPCDNERKNKHRLENIDRYREKAINQYYKHRVLQPSRPFKKDDPEYIKQRNRNYIERPDVKVKKSASDKKYRENNAERVRQNKMEYKQSGRALLMAKEWQARQRNKIEFVTKKRLRGRIYMALKRGVKSESTMSLLGCTIEYFKSYFQSLFIDGMTWDKYMAGEIVIDHIKPCKEFDLTDANQQRDCFHYTNLQPLWELDNLKKGTFYDETHPLCQKKV